MMAHSNIGVSCGEHEPDARSHHASAPSNILLRVIFRPVPSYGEPFGGREYRGPHYNIKPGLSKHNISR